MGAVTTDAVLLVVFIRKGVHIGVRLHRLVESGVEGHDLRHIRQHVRDGLDAEQVGRVVERGEVAADLDLLQHVLADEGAPGEEIRALHDAVADGLDVVEAGEHAVLGIHEGVEHELHADFVVRNGLGHGVRLFAGGLMGKAAVGQADLLDQAFGQQIIDIVVLHVQQLVLDRRAAAIDNQNNHTESFFSLRRKITKYCVFWQKFD